MYDIYYLIDFWMDASIQIQTLIRTDCPELEIASLQFHDLLYRRVGVMMPVEAYSLISALQVLFPGALNIEAMQFALWGIIYRLDEPTSGHCLRVAALLDWILESEGSFEHEDYSNIYLNPPSIFGAGIIHDVLKVLFAEVLHGLTHNKAKKELIPDLKVSHTGPLPYWLASLASHFEINPTNIVLPSIIGTMHHMPHYPRKRQMIILPTLEFASLNEDIIRSHQYLTHRLGTLQSRNPMKRSSVNSVKSLTENTIKELSWVVAAATVADNFDALSSSRPYREGDEAISWEIKKARGIKIIRELPPAYLHHVEHLLLLIRDLDYERYRDELVSRAVKNMIQLYLRMGMESNELAKYLLEYIEIRDTLIVPGREVGIKDLGNIIRNVLSK